MNFPCSTPWILFATTVPESEIN